jgi:hypothetical protein
MAMQEERRVLAIRGHQMRAFESQMAAGFEARMAAHLKRRFCNPCATMSEAALRDSVESGIQRAARYGVTTEYDLARFIDLMYAVSPEFDALPWAAPILNDPRTGSHPKMDEVWARAEQEVGPLRPVAEHEDRLPDTHKGRAAPASSEKAGFDTHRTVGSPKQPCPGVWIEIKLVDEEGQPVPGERYRVELKDGSAREGNLDAEGKARLEGLERGNCQITFPDMDRRTWHRT